MTAFNAALTSSALTDLALSRPINKFAFAGALTSSALASLQLARPINTFAFVGAFNVTSFSDIGQPIDIFQFESGPAITAANTFVGGAIFIDRTFVASPNPTDSVSPKKSIGYPFAA